MTNETSEMSVESVDGYWFVFLSLESPKVKNGHWYGAVMGPFPTWQDADMCREQAEACVIESTPYPHTELLIECADLAFAISGKADKYEDFEFYSQLAWRQHLNCFAQKWKVARQPDQR